MRVAYLTEKGSADITEDAYLLQAPLFGVFDGASSLIPYRDANGRTGGYLAAHIAQAAFASATGSLEERLRKANESIRTAMAEAGVDLTDKKGLWTTTVAAVLVDEEHIDWLRLSDSAIVFVYKDGTYRMEREEPDHDLAWKRQLRDLRTKDAHAGKEHVWSEILATRERMNRDYGFLDGEPEAPRFAVTGREELARVASILIISDGLLLPKEDIEAPEDVATLVDLFLQGGLEAVRDRVRALERADPLARRYLRFKPHDDATGIALYF